MSMLHDELTIGPLSAEIAALITVGDDAGILAVLTRRDIPARGDIRAHDVRQYLMLHDLLLSIESSSALSCVAVTRALELFPVFDTANPVILSKMGTLLDMLVQEPLIPAFTVQHKADILAMGEVLVSRTEQIGLVVSETDIRREIWADDGTRLLS